MAENERGLKIATGDRAADRQSNAEQTVVIARRAATQAPAGPTPTLAQRQDSLRQALSAVNDALATEDADAAQRGESIDAADTRQPKAVDRTPPPATSAANKDATPPRPPVAKPAAGSGAKNENEGVRPEPRRAKETPTPTSTPGQESRPNVPSRGEHTDMNAPKTQIVRGQRRPTRTDFHQEPVVGWLVVIGGPGLGAFRPLFTGNNTLGRASTNRVPIDFGDDAISSLEQGYVRYDAADREFLFVPNLSKTNVVSVNEHKPTTAVRLQPMDVITMGQTQLVFVPFCGEDFDWSELADLEG